VAEYLEEGHEDVRPGASATLSNLRALDIVQAAGHRIENPQRPELRLQYGR